MSIHIAWHSQTRRIIVLQITGEADWEAFQSSITTIGQWLDKSPHRVSIVLDVRDMGKLPTGALNHFRRYMTLRHPRFSGYCIVVGGESTFKPLTTIIERMPTSYVPNVRMYFADSLNEARNIVNVHVPSTDQLPPVP